MRAPLRGLAAPAIALACGACSLVMDVDSLRRGGSSGAPGGATPDAGDARATLFREDFESFALGETWAEGTAHGPWWVPYAGSGPIAIERDGTQTLSLFPAASGAGQAFSALVRTTATFGDLDVTLRMKTVAQLRTTGPEPTETAELLWHLDARDDRCNYLLLRAGGGWELGTKSLGAGAQTVLASGTDAVTVTTWSAPRVRQVGAAITMWLDASGPPHVATDPAPRAGTLGLYVDDAHARFDDLVVLSP